MKGQQVENIRVSSKSQNTEHQFYGHSTRPNLYRQSQRHNSRNLVALCVLYKSTSKGDEFQPVST